MSGKHYRADKGPPQKPPRPLSEVAYAGPGDLDDLIWFLRSVRDEIGDGRVEDTIMVQLAHDLTSRIDGIALIVRGTLGVEASLGIRFQRPLLLSTHDLRVVWNVVTPELRRSTGHAKSLLIAARSLADRMGRRLLFEEFTPDPAAGKMRLLARHLQPAGAVFLYAPEVA